MGKAIDRSRQIVDQMVKGVEFLLSKNKVTVIAGEASFETPHELARRPVGERRSTPTNVIIATGARPRALPGLATDGDDDHQQPRGARAARAAASPSSSSAAARSASSSRRSGAPTASRSRSSRCSTTCCRSKTKRSARQLERAFKKQGIKFITGAQVARRDRRERPRHRHAHRRRQGAAARRRQGARSASASRRTSRRSASTRIGVADRARLRQDRRRPHARRRRRLRHRRRHRHHEPRARRLRQGVMLVERIAGHDVAGARLREDPARDVLPARGRQHRPHRGAGARAPATT